MDVNYRDAAERLGWKVYEDDSGVVEFEKYSPAGEDFIFSIEGIKDPYDEVVGYLSDYDPDYHAEELIYFRHEGRARGNMRGIPSCEVCVQDAKDILDMICELANAFREVSHAKGL